MPTWRPPRRVGAWLAAVFATASASLVAFPARSAVTKLQAVGETTIGVTDNAQSAPDVPLPGGSEKSPGAFLVLRPGLNFGVSSPRTVQRLTYTFDYNLYFSRTNSTSSSNRLEYRGFFDLAPTVDATLGASATESDSYATMTLAAPGSGILPLLPGGTGQLFQAEADELVNVQVGVGWRAWERAGLVFGAPLFDSVAPQTLSPTGRVGLEYSWEGTALGAEGRATYIVVRDGVRPDGTPVSLDRKLTLGGVGLARHDLGRYFTSRLEGGALMIRSIERRESRWYPVATAALGYADTAGDATLSYSHGVTTSVLIGQTLVFDEVRLRGGLALDRRARFLVASSAGYQRGQIVDENSRLGANVSILLLDATFGWQLEPWLLVGVRAQHIDQRSDARVVSLPVSFLQNSIMLGAVLRFPPDAAGPGTYRAPQRVDRSDELRGVGATGDEIVAAPSGRAR